MHVLQWIAVEAEDKDEAFRVVQNNLEDILGNEYSSNAWFDWFVVGGGRWNVSEDEDFKEAYVGGKTNMIIHAGSDLDKFKEQIEGSLVARKAEFDRYASEAKPELLAKIISNYNPREVDYTYFTDLYSVKKVIDMAYGEWDFNSYFYDMQNDTANPKYTLEAIDKTPNVWYLIPVDFHF